MMLHDVNQNPDSDSLFTDDKVQDFVEYAEKELCMRNFDWQAWTAEYKKYENRPDFIENADIGTLRKLVTVIVRGERFNAGVLQQAIDNGMLNVILKRLKVLQNVVQRKNYFLERKASLFFATFFLLVGFFLLLYSQFRHDQLYRWTGVEVISRADQFTSLSKGSEVILQAVKLPLANAVGDSVEYNFVLFRKYKIVLGSYTVPKTSEKTYREQIAEFLPVLPVEMDSLKLNLVSSQPYFILPAEKDENGMDNLVDIAGETVISGYEAESDVTVFGKKRDDFNVEVTLFCSKDKKTCLADVDFYRYISLLFVGVAWLFAFAFYKYSRKKRLEKR